METKDKIAAIESGLVAGNCYQIKRVTGKIVKFKLDRYIPENRRFEFKNGAFDSCDYDSMLSIKRIDESELS